MRGFGSPADGGLHSCGHRRLRRRHLIRKSWGGAGKRLKGRVAEARSGASPFAGYEPLSLGLAPFTRWGASPLGWVRLSFPADYPLSGDALGKNSRVRVARTTRILSN